MKVSQPVTLPKTTSTDKPIKKRIVLPFVSFLLLYNPAAASAYGYNPFGGMNVLSSTSSPPPVKSSCAPTVRPVSSSVGRNYVPTVRPSSPYVGRNYIPTFRSSSSSVGRNYMPTPRSSSSSVGRNYVPTVRSSSLSVKRGYSCAPTVRPSSPYVGRSYSCASTVRYSSSSVRRTCTSIVRPSFNPYQ